MAKFEQLEKGALRNYLNKSEKKAHKKLRNRAIRREAKNIENANPATNRYNGWRL